MRRAKLEGRRIGRAPLKIDRVAIVADRRSGMSLTKVAKKYHGDNPDAVDSQSNRGQDLPTREIMKPTQLFL
jgi:hypothetical protein